MKKRVLHGSFSSRAKKAAVIRHRAGTRSPVFRRIAPRGAMDDLIGHSISCRVAAGPRAGQKVFALQMRCQADAWMRAGRRNLQGSCDPA
jgi:hypothetical protein